MAGLAKRTSSRLEKCKNEEVWTLGQTDSFSTLQEMDFGTREALRQRSYSIFSLLLSQRLSSTYLFLKQSSIRILTLHNLFQKLDVSQM